MTKENKENTTEKQASETSTEELSSQTVQSGQMSGQKPEQPTLSVQDLALAVNLVHTAIKRGTYEPEELEAVGKIYKRLNDFVSYQGRLEQERLAEQKGEK